MIDLIGVHGLLGVGKDTFANFLTDHTPCWFAEPLRRGLLALDPYILLSESELHKLSELGMWGWPIRGWCLLSIFVSAVGWDEAKKNPMVRSYMQKYGTEAGRNIHGQDCWIKIAEKFVDDHEKVVIRDVRFENEISAIYAWEFTKPKLKNKTVLVKMLGESRREHVQEATKHASEQGLPDWQFDYLLFNNGTLEDLEWAAKRVVNSLPPKRPLKIICHSRTITEVTE